MSKIKNILVITSGGLSPSLNPTLYGVVSEAKKNGYKIYGGVSGWHSLSKQGKIVDLTNLNLESIKYRGGNFLRSSRINPFKTAGGIKILKEKLKKYSIDCLITIGGDDTLSAGYRLWHQEKIPVIGLPKTIDNDLPKTYFSPGFISAAHYLAKLTAETKEDSAYALSRVFIIETMGAKSGWLACSAALGGADVIIPPEWPFKLQPILNRIKKKYQENKKYCVVVISKEAQIQNLKGIKDKQIDGFGNTRNEFIGIALQRTIKKSLGYNTKMIVPMNYLQSGDPIKLDWELSVKLGQKGIQLFKKGEFGQVPIIKIKNRKFVIESTELAEMTKNKKRLPANFFNKKTLQPTDEFFSYLKPVISQKDFINSDYQKLCNKIK